MATVLADKGMVVGKDTDTSIRPFHYLYHVDIVTATPVLFPLPIQDTKAFVDSDCLTEIVRTVPMEIDTGIVGSKVFRANAKQT